MARSRIMKQMLEDDDMRAKLFILFWLASICAMVSLFIGSIVFIVIVLRNVGIIPF